MNDNAELAEELHRAGENAGLEREEIADVYDGMDRTESNEGLTEYLAEELHRTGEEMGLEREKVADVYNWLNGTDAEEVAQENTEEYLKKVDQAYDRLEEESNVDRYSTGIAWDAAGEAFSALEDQ